MSGVTSRVLVSALLLLVVAAIPSREITVTAEPLSIPLAIGVNRAPATAAAWPE
jgi:hypothetical protein